MFNKHKDKTQVTCALHYVNTFAPKLKQHTDENQTITY
jgi:hypothetical protein